MASEPFDLVVEDDLALERLGYKQELKRSFNFLSMLGFSFSIVSCWSALSGVLIIGAESGGPPVMVWSWIGVSICSLAVAFSMAEMCSAYPVAGGQYSWVAIVAPQRWARGLSYVCGWFMLTGILAMGAVNNFITAGFILAVAELSNPDLVVTRWKITLVAFAVALSGLSFNTLAPQLLHKLSRFFLIWNICAFIIVIVTILACNDHKQSASFVFSEFQNMTGFGSAYTAILGLLQTAFGMCCYDAPSHMTEEIRDARKEAPRAIVLSVSIGAITGFIFLVAASFCISTIDGVANSATGSPIVQIFYDSTESVAGSTCLTVLLIVINIGCSNALTAEGGRAVYAFARDQGLPFSKLLSSVDKKRQIPTYAILLTTATQIALNSIYFGTVTGFNTVVSIATEGFYISYAMPICAKLLSAAIGQAIKLDGLWNLGRWSVPVNLVGAIYLLFTSITFNFPTENPVDSQNMNYTSAAIGLMLLLAALTWMTTGRRVYQKPQSILIEGTEVEMSESRPEQVKSGGPNKAD
ncbi:putative GABA permease, partial [Aureobasidium melanogenum]